MTSTDEAEKLLPCGRECHDTLEGFTHVNCCAGYRTAVSAALSARDERIAVLEKALEQIAAMGEEGMKPDYGEWLTFHDKVAQIARSVLSTKGDV